MIAVRWSERRFEENHLLKSSRAATRHMEEQQPDPRETDLDAFNQNATEGNMLRNTFTVLMALLAGSACLSEVQAQNNYPLPPAPNPPGVRVGQPTMQNVSHPNWHLPGRPAASKGAIKGYPRLNAPLYSSPQQNIPPQTGGTMITNQAFSPHEMLYPHEYRSLYGPFYYRVKGNWIWTPFGMESHDKWELMGTEVKVKYRSTPSLFSLFTPR